MLLVHFLASGVIFRFYCVCHNGYFVRVFIALIMGFIPPLQLFMCLWVFLECSWFYGFCMQSLEVIYSFWVFFKGLDLGSSVFFS